MPLVLVIEDTEDVRNNIIEILGYEGHDAHGAATGTEALELVRQILPDIIICDIMLPDLDGYSILERLREDPETSTIPLIFLTALGDRNHIRRGMEMGAADYIPKPWNGDELVSAVKTRLARREQEKKNLFADMHDHLGSLLTDIVLMTGAMLREGEPTEALSELHRTGRRAMAAFRDGLSENEDQDLLAGDLPDALHLILKRRYQFFKRNLRFDADDAAVQQLRSGLDLRIRTGLYLILKEVATNDLKYGTGDSTLTISGEADRLRLVFSSRRSEVALRDGLGFGKQGIRERVRSLRGTIETEESADGRVRITATLPAAPGGNL